MSAEEIEKDFAPYARIVNKGMNHTYSYFMTKTEMTNEILNLTMR